ncbi:hypothetical protein VitviT2T_013815 [Vitis vinifera]|uniref:Uncharacterized protein n=1 Tax=Vitis vinifera TaxID=29760 RepID=A0ABY9CM38_VITVI|nr:hypothetical protein VitviT2T_013815 [Vitis vinifera]
MPNDVGTASQRFSDCQNNARTSSPTSGMASQPETKTRFIERNAIGITLTGGMASHSKMETAFARRNIVGVVSTGGMASQPEMASQVASFPLLSSLVTWVCNPSGGLEVDGSQHLSKGLDGMAHRVEETAISRFRQRKDMESFSSVF